MAEETSLLMMYLSKLFFTTTVLFNVCAGGEYCRDGTYCSDSCCDDDDGECCDADVALIVGLCIGGAVLVISIIVIVCCYRRRGSRGIVYRQNNGTTVITQTTVAASGTVINPGSMVPGPAYPPTGAAYGHQPMAAPYNPATYSAHPYGKPLASATAPPPYSEVAGGADNPNFGNKN